MGIAEKHLDCMSVGKELLCKIPRGDLWEPSRPRPYSLQRRLRNMKQKQPVLCVCSLTPTSPRGLRSMAALREEEAPVLAP